jgi:hypothetical protein
VSRLPDVEGEFTGAGLETPALNRRKFPLLSGLSGLAINGAGFTMV